MTRIVAFTIVLISMVLIEVLANRNCYLCNSYSDSDHTACVDPMSPYPAVNYTSCSDNYACTRISYITQKQFVVSRGCDPTGDTCNNLRKELSSFYPDLAAFVCSACTTDLCNGGGS